MIPLPLHKGQALGQLSEGQGSVPRMWVCARAGVGISCRHLFQPLSFTVLGLEGQRRKRGLPGLPLRRVHPHAGHWLCHFLHLLEGFCLLRTTLGSVTHRIGCMVVICQMRKLKHGLAGHLPEEPNLVLAIPKPFLLPKSRSPPNYLFRAHGHMTKKWPT